MKRIALVLIFSTFKFLPRGPGIHRAIRWLDQSPINYLTQTPSDKSRRYWDLILAPRVLVRLKVEVPGPPSEVRRELKEGGI
jgi:hypothetical protein